MTDKSPEEIKFDPPREAGPASEKTKADMIADFTPLLEDVRASIAGLEAGLDSPSEEEQEKLDDLRDQAYAFEEIIKDCQNPDWHGRISPPYERLSDDVS